MNKDELAAAYLAAQQAYERAIQVEIATKQSLGQATYNAVAGGSPPPGNSTVQAVEMAATKQAKASAAQTTHDAAVADIATKLATRDQAWSALVAAS